MTSCWSCKHVIAPTKVGCICGRTGKFRENLKPCSSYKESEVFKALRKASE